MAKLRGLIWYWLPVLIWMVLIFSVSSDQKSFQHSSRLIGPVLHWLFPHLPESQIGELVFGVRKCAHLTEYALLALLAYRALHGCLGNDTPGWQTRIAGLALVFVALYATTDEIHQTFVPTRQGSAWDVAIDTAGGALALLFAWSIGRCRQRWSRPRELRKPPSLCA